MPMHLCTHVQIHTHTHTNTYGSDNAPHYGDVIMGAMASQITSLTIVYSTVYSDADQRKYQSSASLAFVRGIHRSPVNSPHTWPVRLKMFPFDDVIMHCDNVLSQWQRSNWSQDIPFVLMVSWNHYDSPGGWIIICCAVSNMSLPSIASSREGMTDHDKLLKFSHDHASWFTRIA